MKIEIWSDILCPFCYIGKKHLEIAISQLEFKDQVQIFWRSFQLDPNLSHVPLEMNKEEYLASRGYPKDQVNAMFQQLQAAGKALGIEFNQEQSILVNSRRAHALIHYAAQFNKASLAKEALFKAHFTDAMDIANVNILKHIAISIGLDAVKAWKYIENGHAEPAIKSDIEKAAKIGIKGVPFFLIANKYGISGAQPIKLIKETIEKAYDEANTPQVQIVQNKESNGSDSDMTCGPEGCKV